MFKKLIIAAISASFLASAAFADSTNIGVRLSAANMAASGTENTNLAGTNVTQKEKDADFYLPSIFVERQMDLESGISIAVGLDFNKSLLLLTRNLCVLFSIIAKTIPYAAVAPIKGAPLTSIFFIALTVSLTVLSSLILN